MDGNLRKPPAKTRATLPGCPEQGNYLHARERLRRLLCESGLSQEAAAGLIGADGRQVRRWLAGSESLGPLELVCLLERHIAATRAA